MRSGEYDPKVAAVNKCGLLNDIGSLSNDPTIIAEAAQCIEGANALDSNSPALSRALAALARNDPRPAMRLNLQAGANWSIEFARYAQARVRLSALLLSGNSPELAAALEEYREAARGVMSTGFLAQSYRAAAPVEDWPLEAEGLVALGRVEEARSVISRTPLDCYECVRVRGFVARAMGEAPAAQRWYAEAVRQGPRLAAAYADWGRLLAQHRRYRAAEAKFSEAARLAPNWADPLKYWGDALAAQGQSAEASAKYEAALKLAPQWAELVSTRARLLARMSGNGRTRT